MKIAVFLLLLFINIDTVCSQSISNFVNIYYEGKGAHTYESTRYIEGDSYNYLFTVGNQGHLLFQDERLDLTPSADSLIGIWSNRVYTIFKLTKDNQYVDHEFLLGERLINGGNRYAFSDVQIDFEGKSLYVSGSFRGNTFFYKGEKLHSAKKQLGFLLKLNEDLELQDSMFIDYDYDYGSLLLSGLNVKAGKIHLAGHFSWPGNEPFTLQEFYINIGKDSLQNAYADGCLSTDFYIRYDMDKDSIEQAISYGGCRGNYYTQIHSPNVDLEGNVYLCNSYYGGSGFDILGHKEPTIQTTAYKVTTVKLNASDEVENIMLQHGMNLHSLRAFGIGDDNATYEATNIGSLGNVIINNDTFLREPTNFEVSDRSAGLLIKRNGITNEILWHYLAKCPEGSGWSDMDCDYNDYIVLSRINSCKIDNPYTDENYRGQSDLFFIDKNTGSLVSQIQLMAADDTFEFLINKVKSNKDGTIKIIGYMGYNEDENSKVLLRIGDEIKEIDKPGSTVIFDFDPLKVNVEDYEHPKRIEVAYPNPISAGGNLFIDGDITPEKAWKVFDLYGRYCGDHINGKQFLSITPGIYLLKKENSFIKIIYN